MRQSKTSTMSRCALFTALVAISAYIQIPVPFMDYFTLQFFFVLLAGMILGKTGSNFSWTLCFNRTFRSACLCSRWRNRIYI